jgi:hypothetical protein
MSAKPRKTIRYEELVREIHDFGPEGQDLNWERVAMRYWLCQHQIWAHRHDVAIIQDSLHCTDAMQAEGSVSDLRAFFLRELDRHGRALRELADEVDDLMENVQLPQMKGYLNWVRRHCRRWLELPIGGS